MRTPISIHVPEQYPPIVIPHRAFKSHPLDIELSLRQFRMAAFLARLST